ncbi:MAG: 3-hydroxyacyl-ACP dehydratase [Proteobacteria bacterium]|nr:3-hydroxyacyl-ACP dehydratase [Desulfobulbaceae bacterium]MBU4151538.1 3-hydroxyacyl-ACP dehydratase [Pseudomonadota bacterium]MDP2104758.1 acyl-CoA dehydratase activase [Desulfobulbaceae bacterium]
MDIGIDLGSRALKMAVFDGDELLECRMVESGFTPHQQAEELLKGLKPHRVIATGYGRHLAHKNFASGVITEIKAHSLGARYFFPQAMTILDVGGQDSKVITLNREGKVVNFQMNDKCAAGTGRFLEIMAASLGYTLAEFGPMALSSDHEAPINSMCTVFAESEVISLKNHGVPAADIARALHLAVVSRLVGMVRRMEESATLVFTGGVARNPAIVSLLQERLGVEVFVPSLPEHAGAVGAALHARTL